jgi:hypothetical protein
MKYIKKFENVDEIKTGDIVKVKWILSVPILYRDEIGEVVDSEQGKFDYVVYILRYNTNVAFYKKELIKATPEQVEQYELEKNVDKYNL